MTIKFENLPNELFIEIYRYLTSVDVISAFWNLNSRFQLLILNICQSLDLKSINKTQFDLILNSFDLNRWKSLKLSNSDQTPGQIDYFLNKYSTKNHFLRLEFLSLLGLKSSYRNELLFRLFAYVNLISLELESICGRYMFDCRLLTLKQLVITSCRHTNWITKLPQIEIVEYRIISCCFDERKLLWPSTLKHLKIIYSLDTDCLLIQHSLINLSQLITLQIYQEKRGRLAPDGQIWQEIIHSSLPLLKDFKFYFEFSYYYLYELDQAIKSFDKLEYQKHFHREIFHIPAWSGNSPRLFSIIYSLPYPWKLYNICSTSIKRDISVQYQNFDNVKTLIIDGNEKPKNHFNSMKISNLIINTSFDPILWLFLFKNLTYLDLSNCKLFSKNQFEMILDHAPHLSALTIKFSFLEVLTENWSNKLICDHLSKKIRWLKFHSNTFFPELINQTNLKEIFPIFSFKCQYLSLYVQSLIDTIDFIVSNMSNLLSLHLHTDENISSLEYIQANYSNWMFVNDENEYYFWLD